MVKIPRIIIVGGGPAGLMVATQLMRSPVEITIVDHKPTVGRKFLVAGEGGFNLTHSEPLDQFVEKYDHPQMKEWVKQFTPSDFRHWLASIGIDTRIGSSGKVFPIESIKPVQVLKAWLKQLNDKSIHWKLKSSVIDFTDKSIVIESGEGRTEMDYDFLVFALGGASWKKTGSDGKWYELFTSKHIPMIPFQSGNTGLELPIAEWRMKHEGQFIKNCKLTMGELAISGDLVITHYGIEGKPAYAVNRALREGNFQGLMIDFKPQLSLDKIESVILQSKNSRAAFDQLKLGKTVYAWLREELPKEQFTDAKRLALAIKSFQPTIQGLRPIDEAISTVGGVSMSGIDARGCLKTFERVYCCGEMINWDAPTGGYLIQGCVSSGFIVGQAINDEIQRAQN